MMDQPKAYDDYETWLSHHWDELSAFAAEIGADQQADFDWEVFVASCYDDYLREAA